MLFTYILLLPKIWILLFLSGKSVTEHSLYKIDDIKIIDKEPLEGILNEEIVERPSDPKFQDYCIDSIGKRYINKRR